MIIDIHTHRAQRFSTSMLVQNMSGVLPELTEIRPQSLFRLKKNHA